MAGIRKIYTSGNEYLEDIAKNSKYFDESQYEKQKESGTGLAYLNLITSGVENLPSDFDDGFYDRLSSDDKLNYFAFKTNSSGMSSEDYEKNTQYFDSLKTQIKNQDVYNGLSDIEKIMHTGAGLIGNLALQVGGIAEGLIDAGSLMLQGIYTIAGDEEKAEFYKQNIVADNTGYNAAQDAMNEYLNQYTFVDKNVVLKAINDIGTGIVRMTPMLIPGAGPMGTFTYYTSMAGNTAQEALHANPDIGTGNLWAYTLGSVGLEAGIEYLSGDTIAKLAFGGKAGASTTLLKSVGLNFLSEGIEEGTSELFGSLLYKQFVDQTADVASVEDILYAAIIGGLTGAVMTGGQGAIRTSRYSVTKDGKLVLTKDAPSEAKKVGLNKSYAIQGLIQEIQQNKEAIDEVTKLKAKYGESLDSIIAKHGAEYQKALAKDTTNKKAQATAILDLANLMNNIGVEQFTRSTKYLEDSLADAQQRIDNYFNHSDVVNAVASAVYSQHNPGKNWTPTVAANDEQTLSKVLREIVPGLHVSFGKAGSSDGSAVRYISSNGSDYLFIESGMVDTMGYDALMNHAINFVIKDGLVQQLDKLNIALGDIIDISFGEKRFKELSLEDKQSFAERILFDQIYNKRVFCSDKKVHSQIFNYLTKETEKLQKYGRKTDANKVKFNNLLKIRNKFLQSVAEVIGNDTDYASAQSVYQLSNDELQSKIIDKSETTILNNKQRLMNLKQAQQSISRTEAINDLLAHRTETDKTVDFDWNRLYDETYYSTTWSTELKQKAMTDDFGEALRDYIATAHATELNIDIRNTLLDVVVNQMTDDELNKTAESLLTKEYLDSVTNQTDLQIAVANTLFNLSQDQSLGVNENADSVVVSDSSVEGTGDLRFFKEDIYDRFGVFDRKQRRDSSESTERKPERVVSGTRKYQRTEVSGVSIDLQDDTTYDDFQHELTILTKTEYGLNLHFFRNSVVDIDTGIKSSSTNGFIIGTDIYLRYDNTRSDEKLLHTLRHEVTHRLIALYPEAYKKAKQAFETKLRNGNYTKMMYKIYSQSAMYGKSYKNDNSKIEEEVIVNLLIERDLYDTTEQALVDEISQEFYKEVMGSLREDLEWLWNPDYDADVDYNKTPRTIVKKDIVNRDNEGRLLSPQQIKYFNKSAVRDYKGRLLTMYHGTASGGFTTFDSMYSKYGAYGKGFYFTDNHTVATEYSATKRGNGNRQVYPVYLNITNPIDMNAPADVTLWKKSVPDNVNLPEIGDNTDFFRTLEQYYMSMEIPQDEIAENIKYIIRNMGYDGITYIGGRFLPSSTIEHRVYIAFDSNQIKSIANTNPTESSDIRFSKETKQPNITKEDISQLASTKYKTGEIRKSTAKGFEDVEYEKASVMDYELQNHALLSKIKTLNDLETVLEAVSNGEISGLEATFLLDLIQAQVIPFNFKGKQSAKDLLEKYLAARTTETAQELAARSELFSETHAVESFVKELSEKTGTPVELSDKLITKWVPYYADRSNYLAKIKAEYDELLDLRKNTKDPYLIQQYTLQLKELRDLARMVSDGNTAAVLDYTIRKLQDADTNKAENNEKIMEITRDTVAELVSHTNMNTHKPTYDPNKKYTLSPEHAAKVAAYWETINSFRYLAMLSSPTTWGRNALTNTLISLNAIVEDATSKNIEKTNFLRAESQANYTGDYDDNFAKFVEEEYSVRIDKDTKGDKYHEKELDAIRQEYAQENDPLKKHEYLYKIKQFEQKMLNDQKWTKRRVMRNLKGTLAGSINMISNAAYSELKGMYRGDTPSEILANMRKTNSPLADLFEQVYITNKGNDMVGTIQLASKLNKTSLILDSIYDNSLHRGNKLLFKTDNFLTKAIGKLNKSHPMAAAFVSMFVPFARTSANTTMYIINHSPIGIAKGIVQSLQTRNMYVGEMRNAIRQYYKDQYISQHKDANKDLNFDENAFSEWMSKNLSSEQLSAINGDYNAIKSVFNALSEEGKVNSSAIGSNNMFARATTIESLTQGLNGTAWMALGLILASMIKGFKIDDDDYLGPVLTIGDIKWKLSDLSPFATMFSVGAVINSSDNVLDGFENFFKILIDESMLNVVESALQYSDSIPDYLGNQFINIVQQYIPAVFKNITKVIDNGKKDKSGNYFEKLLKTTISNLPLFSYLVADKIDPYTGETQKIYRSGLLESLFNQISPIGFRTTAMSDTERDMRTLGVETTGLTGRFTVNDKDYTVKDKQKYAKYRADYIEKQYNLIVSGKQSVTVEDDKGNRITTTYNKLTDKQKKNVINRLYTEATNMTKIKWWLDSGNSYVVTSRDLYNEYRSLYNTNKIIYKKTWSKSKFVEA